MTGRMGQPAATMLLVDGVGDVVVTGTSIWSRWHDYATIKYSSSGVPLWTNRYDGPDGPTGSDYASAVAVDSSDNVLVTGSSQGGGYLDYATIKYSSAGVALWTNRYSGPGSDDDRANALALDSSGSVIVTGSSGNNYSSPVYATIKYSSAGEPLWTNRYGGPGYYNYSSAYAVAVDKSGNVFVTGSSDGDYVTIKYSGAGLPMWTNRYNGPGNGYNRANAVALDSSGNVFVMGYGGRMTNIYSYYTGYATVAYSSAGVPLWTNRFDGPGNSNDRAKAVAVDRSGNVFVTGSSWS